ncbi:hypothetical protein RZN22_13375 [Bacillaceae bacterium S4-13-58]
MVNRVNRYAKVVVGGVVNPNKINLIYSLKDLQEEFHWIVLNVDTENLFDNFFESDVVDLFDMFREGHTHFQVRFIKDIQSLVESLTEGNYLWIDTRDVHSEDGLIFFHEEHERKIKVI